MEVQMGRVGFMGVNVSIIYCIIYVIISRDRKFIHHNCHCIFFVIFEKYLIKTSHNGAGSQVTDDINNLSDESGIMDHDSETEND